MVTPNENEHEMEQALMARLYFSLSEARLQPEDEPLIRFEDRGIQRLSEISASVNAFGKKAIPDDRSVVSRLFPVHRSLVKISMLMR